MERSDDKKLVETWKIFDQIRNLWIFKVIKNCIKEFETHPVLLNIQGISEMDE